MERNEIYGMDPEGCVHMEHYYRERRGGLVACHVQSLHLWHAPQGWSQRLDRIKVELIGALPMLQPSKGRESEGGREESVRVS